MRFDLPESTRAPGRGRYERGRAGSERFRAQRERLLRSTAIAHLEGAASVTRVTALSGVGRNTFYECFDDFPHALEVARREELQRFRRGLDGLGVYASAAEGVNGLCRLWLELIAAEPIRTLVALEPARGEQSSALVTAFYEALAWVSSGSVESGAAENDSPRPGRRALLHAAVCAEASGRALALALLSSSQAAPISALVGERTSDGSLPVEALLALNQSIRCLVGL